MIPGQEFAYSQSPDTLKGVVMGMFLLTMGLGHFLGSALLNLVNAATANGKYAIINPYKRTFLCPTMQY